MFDATVVAGAVLDEVRVLMTRFLFPDQPGVVTIDDKIAEQGKTSPLPTEAQIAALLEPLFWASLLREEGRPTRFRVGVHDPDVANDRYIGLICLAPRLEVEPRGIKKISPAHDPSASYLEVWFDEDRPYVYGIAGFRTGPNAVSPLLFSVSSQTPGTLDVAWAGHRLVRFQHGRIDRLSHAPLLNTDIDAWITGVFSSNSEIRWVIDRTVQSIAGHGHGGSLWILQAGQRVPTQIRIQHATMPVESLPYETTEPEKARKWATLLGRLSAVDGAVLIDDGAHLLGFGSFINLQSAFQVVRYGPQGAELVSAEEVGGGRHRAGLTFCNTTAPSVAIVVSEDGGVSLVRRQVMGRRAVEVVSLSPLGFESPLGFDVGNRPAY